MDQYLYRYIAATLNWTRRWNSEHAIEMLHSCWLKLLEVDGIPLRLTLGRLLREVRYIGTCTIGGKIG
ncbi:hypothetical protein ACNKHV_04775 [Shigella flexneri]